MDDDTGYPIDSPKHPDYRDRMFDAADERDER
jgi:hypothetical protein